MSEAIVKQNKKGVLTPTGKKQVTALLMIEQDGRCCMCGFPLMEAGGYRPALDHCHTSGKVRGVAHIVCNAREGALARALDKQWSTWNDKQRGEVLSAWTNLDNVFAWDIWWKLAKQFKMPYRTQLDVMESRQQIIPLLKGLADFWQRDSYCWLYELPDCHQENLRMMALNKKRKAKTAKEYRLLEKLEIAMAL